MAWGAASAVWSRPWPCFRGGCGVWSIAGPDHHMLTSDALAYNPAVLPPAPAQRDPGLQPNPGSSGLAGSLELQLPDMVRGARGPELCSARLARRGAGPRCSLFRCRRVRGWWPVVKLREPEDEQREQREAQAGRKRRRRRRKGRPEDLEFADSGGNVYILTVGAARPGSGLAGARSEPPKSSARSLFSRGRWRQSLSC